MKGKGGTKVPDVALGRVLGRLSYLLSHSKENRELGVLASFTLFHFGDSGLLFITADSSGPADWTL